MGDGVSEKDSLRRGRSRSQSFEGKSRSRSASVETDFDPLKTELTRDEFVAYVENPRKQPARGISYTEALAAPPEVATPVREALDKARHKHRFDDPKKRVFSQASAQKLNELANIDDALEFDFTNQAELHNIDKAKLAHELRSDLERGLPAELAAEKLAEDGPNELEKPPRVTFFVLFLIQLSQIITLLLIAACVASACVNATDAARRGSALSYVDSIAIFIIVFLNAYIAAASENAANGALEALDALSSPVSVAVRDGEEVELDSTQLVVGDVILLATGDVVPADCRVVRAADLKVNEMLLTGESEDVSKTDKVKPKKPGAAAKLTEDTMIFSSCTVKAGNCRALVVHTGMRTRVGQIAALLTDDAGAKGAGCLPDTKGNMTPLQVQLEKLAVKIGVLAIACCVIVFVVGAAMEVPDPEGNVPSWLYMILIAVTLTVAAIPEGLPLTVTISLSTGCSDMVKENVLVRKIAAVETLGSASVICTDKTGTLTEGKMRCVKALFGGEDYVVSGRGFDPTVGSVGVAGAVPGPDLAFAEGDDARAHANVRAALASAVLCCSTTLNRVEDESGAMVWTPKGNSSEAPIVVAAAKCGLWAADLEPLFPRATEIPFSSSRKMMAVVTAGGALDGAPKAVGLASPYVAHVKGAPNYVLESCAKTLRPDGSVGALDAATRAKIDATVDALSSEALRVLAIACAPLRSLPYDDEADVEDKLSAILGGGLTFLGLVASIDPERQGVKAAIATANSATVRTVMITGDYLKTAQAIARNIGILAADGSQDGDAVDCGSLRPGGGDDYLDEPAMDALTLRVNVFARAKPEDKLEIVKSLQRQGFVSAMTGDGVNDAPALKEADIGVSMGLEGTEVAKGASDMILTDDNFCSIVKAVEKGRGIYSGIEKFVSFIMSVHFAEVLQIFLCVVSGLPIMREPLQILFLVLVTDLPPAIALGVEPPEKGLMDKKPRPKAQPVIMPWMWKCIIANGMIMTAGITATYVVALHAYAGTYLTENIDRKTRDSCVVWGSGMFSSTKYEEFDDAFDEGDDDNFAECTEFAIRKARTVAFIALVWAENIRAYTARSFTEPIWVKTFSNPTMNKAIASAQAALWCALLVPGLSTSVMGLYPFGDPGLSGNSTDSIQWWGWVLAAVGAVACGAGCELYKLYIKLTVGDPHDTVTGYETVAVKPALELP
ncbi:calcium-transporting ATPase [Aureococcus anophagefferens]|uniref:Calcium-transporting ATPase n=1 Tax=Aureococcus anophagefferens TaxID=44056 RepID=A0ABR1FGM0_AURAN